MGEILSEVSTELCGLQENLEEVSKEGCLVVEAVLDREFAPEDVTSIKSELHRESPYIRAAILRLSALATKIRTVDHMKRAVEAEQDIKDARFRVLRVYLTAFIHTSQILVKYPESSASSQLMQLMLSSSCGFDNLTWIERRLTLLPLTVAVEIGLGQLSTQIQLNDSKPELSFDHRKKLLEATTLAQNLRSLVEKIPRVNLDEHTPMGECWKFALPKIQRTLHQFIDITTIAILPDLVLLKSLTQDLYDEIVFLGHSMNEPNPVARNIEHMILFRDQLKHWPDSSIKEAVALHSCQRKVIDEGLVRCIDPRDGTWKDRHAILLDNFFLLASRFWLPDEQRYELGVEDKCMAIPVELLLVRESHAYHGYDQSSCLDIQQLSHKKRIQLWLGTTQAKKHWLATILKIRDSSAVAAETFSLRPRLHAIDQKVSPEHVYQSFHGAGVHASKVRDTAHNVPTLCLKIIRIVLWHSFGLLQSYWLRSLDLLRWIPGLGINKSAVVDKQGIQQLQGMAESDNPIGQIFVLSERGSVRTLFYHKLGGHIHHKELPTNTLSFTPFRLSPPDIRRRASIDTFRDYYMDPRMMHWLDTHRGPVPRPTMIMTKAALLVKAIFWIRDAFCYIGIPDLFFFTLGCVALSKPHHVDVKLPDLRRPAVIERDPGWFCSRTSRIVRGSLGDQKPVEIFNIGHRRMIFVYERCAVYYEEDEQKLELINFIGRVQSVSKAVIARGFLVLFTTQYIEIRDLPTGKLKQIIPASYISYMDPVIWTHESYGYLRLAFGTEHLSPTSSTTDGITITMAPHEFPECHSIFDLVLA
ncbi:hypothetical protein CcaCcLH18_04318 [Colletotrichum camelliae]|nr:hypothetical protein CcaCcLH18_04318 [Colletotrichum camelliae]